MDSKVLQMDLESFGFTWSLAKHEMAKEVGRQGPTRKMTRRPVGKVETPQRKHRDGGRREKAGDSTTSRSVKALEGLHKEAELQRRPMKRDKNLAISKGTCLEKEDRR